MVYPHTKKDLDRLGVKDSELLQLMDKVCAASLSVTAVLVVAVAAVAAVLMRNVAMMDRWRCPTW